MRGHTPGPWKAPLIGGDHGTTGLVWAEERVVATVSSGEESIERQTANAHLIAAAPDMLAALEQIALNGPYMGTRASFMQTIAEHAIAKAKGQA